MYAFVVLLVEWLNLTGFIVYWFFLSPIVVGPDEQRQSEKHGIRIFTVELVCSLAMIVAAWAECPLLWINVLLTIGGFITLAFSGYLLAVLYCNRPLEITTKSTPRSGGY